MSQFDESRPSGAFETVTPSNSTNFTKGTSRGLYIGGAGNIVAVAADDTTATFTAVPAGTVLPIKIKRVNSTSTTATAMVALF